MIVPVRTHIVTWFQQHFLLFGYILPGLILAMCTNQQKPIQQAEVSITLDSVTIQGHETIRAQVIKIEADVTMEQYFSFIDQVVEKIDTTSGRMVNEYTLVHSNPWILDSLRATDYYIQKHRGNFLYDQRKKIIFHRGDSLIIPDSARIASINSRLKTTRIDVNIPEFTLRLIQGVDTLLSTRVRVGQNQKKYLGSMNRMTDLRTPIGEGQIINVFREPRYVDLETGQPYEETKRDDGRITKMPIVPSLEPTINGIRSGTMIHATTNPRSLGKASSHGCIGTTEADAWTIYYHCPVGTPVVFRYNLKVINAQRDTILLKDIYKRINR